MNNKTCDDCAYMEKRSGFFSNYNECLKHGNKSTKPSNPACKDFVPKNNPHAYHRCGLFGYHIATFICNLLGKDENDKVYLSIKALRDEFMENNEDYTALLKEYDIIGPLICCHMALEKNSREMALQLYNTFLKATAIAWDNGEPEKALWTYLTMYDALKKKYNSNNYITNNLDRKPYDSKKLIKKKVN